jgi:glycerol-1-phosphate dehydrogenase [NAD(P)+]
MPDPTQIYGTAFDCECGKHHTVTPKAVIFEDDAIDRLPSVCADVVEGRKCTVIFDTRTREVAGEAVAAGLEGAGWQVDRLLLEDPGEGEDPVCDDVTHAALLSRVQGTDLVVPVGSGVINDLGKWWAHDIGVPFVTFATAASMNGYTSANVAPRIAGVKSLVRAAPPEVALSRPAVIAQAPHRMTVSGLGDVLAKSVSSADWYMNHFLFGDYYCPRSVGLIADIEPLYLEHPEKIRAGDESAIAAMFDALMLTGVAMTMVGTSSPASGGEHLISHSLDMLSAVDGVPHDFHGRQVGVGTILTAALYQRAIEIESPTLHASPAAIDRELWGPLADEVASKYAEKAPRLQSAREKLAEGDTWDRLREALAAKLRPAEKIHGCLQAAGGATTAADIGCDHARLHTAFVHGHEIRPRFTILDLAWILGLMPAAAGELIEQWA